MESRREASMALCHFALLLMCLCWHVDLRTSLALVTPSWRFDTEGALP